MSRPDTSVFESIKPIPIASPLERVGKVLSLQEMIQRSKTQDLQQQDIQQQIQQRQQANTRELKRSQIISAAKTPDEAATALQSAGDMQGALDLRKVLTEATSAQNAAGKAQDDQIKAHAEALSQVAGAILQAPKGQRIGYYQRAFYAPAVQSGHAQALGLPDPQSFANEDDFEQQMQLLHYGGMSAANLISWKTQQGESEKPVVVDGNLVTPNGKVLFTAPKNIDPLSKEGIAAATQRTKDESTIPNRPAGAPAPIPPYSDKRQGQEIELANTRARLAAENKVDPIDVKQGEDKDGNQAFFLINKNDGTVKQLSDIKPTEKSEEPPAPMKQTISVSDRALKQSAVIRDILKQHPEMVGPVMGRLDEFAQGVGSNPFAGDPKLEKLGATLTGHLRYLFAQELKNAIGSRPGEYLAQQLKEASPQRKQNINILNGFLDSVENNANIAIDSGIQQYPKFQPFLRLRPGAPAKTSNDPFVKPGGALEKLLGGK